MKKNNLMQGVDYSHQILEKYIENNDKVVDATVGNGHDTQFLAELVGSAGFVSGFDVQKEALEIVSRTGNINFFAGISGEGELTLNPNQLHYKQISLTGTTGSSLQQFRQVVNLIQNSKLNIEQVVTKVIGLKRLESIFEDKSVFRDNMKIIEVELPSSARLLGVDPGYLLVNISKKDN